MKQLRELIAAHAARDTLVLCAGGGSGALARELRSLPRPCGHREHAALAGLDPPPRGSTERESGHGTLCGLSSMSALNPHRTTRKTGRRVSCAD